MIYLLTGENSYEIDRRLSELVAGYDGDIERVDGSELNVDQLPDLLAGVTLFSNKRLVVFKNASSNKPGWVALGEWFEKGIENDAAIVEFKPDKRAKTYKWLEKHAEVFRAKELSRGEALSWVEREVDKRKLVMPTGAQRFFVDYVGVDQWRLSSELEKLALGGGSIDDVRIRELVEPTPQATSFELLDAVFAGRHEGASKLLAIVSRQEDPYMFFGLLSSQVYALSLVKSAGGKRHDTIAKESGVHPFVLGKVSGLAGKLSLSQVRQMAAELAELDASMKLRPTDPWTQIQATLLRITT